ncbi:ROK family protein [Coriobacteriales bacterium OH1046]|nr:ROK family protein [Coriobacteriales bacterium OH1046]
MSSAAYPGRNLVCGIDLGGTRTKVGFVDLAYDGLIELEVFPTEHGSEELFLDNVAQSMRRLSKRYGRPCGAGVSIGSYTFADGSIDGLSSMVPFLVRGYPLAGRMQDRLGLPVRIGNDAQLACLAEAVCGEGRGFSRVLALTLGTGVGIGLCVDGKPVDNEPYMHLAGHIRVREGGELPWLDGEPCYCGMTGCFESTCSASALLCHVRHELGADASIEELFSRGRTEGGRAAGLVDWYLAMLLRALNQYVYLYCPDTIVLGGGVARSLGPHLARLQEGLVAQVFEGQHTGLRISRLKEGSGVIGAASLFSNGKERTHG